MGNEIARIINTPSFIEKTVKFIPNLINGFKYAGRTFDPNIFGHLLTSNGVGFEPAFEQTPFNIDLRKDVFDFMDKNNLSALLLDNGPIFYAKSNLTPTGIRLTSKEYPLQFYSPFTGVTTKGTGVVNYADNSSHYTYTPVSDVKFKYNLFNQPVHGYTGISALMGYDKNGNFVAPAFISGYDKGLLTKLNTELPDNIRSAMLEYLESLLEKVKPAAVSGSLLGVSKGIFGPNYDPTALSGLALIPIHDIELTTTKEGYDKLSKLIGFKKDRSLAGNLGYHGISNIAPNNGDTDIQILGRANSPADGTIAHQAFRSVIPDYEKMFRDFYKENILGHIEDPFKMPIINNGKVVTNQDVIDLFNNDGGRHQFVDMMQGESSKAEARELDMTTNKTLSADDYILLSKATAGQYMDGYTTGEETFPNIKFDDVESNKKFLEVIGMPSEYATDLERMRKIFEKFYRKTSITSRIIDPNYNGTTTYKDLDGLISAAITNYSPHGGTSMGGGGNNIVGTAKAVIGEHHAIMQQDVVHNHESIKTPMDYANIVLIGKQKVPEDVIELLTLSGENEVLRNAQHNRGVGDLTYDDISKALGYINRPEVTLRISQKLGLNGLFGGEYMGDMQYYGKWTGGKPGSVEEKLGMPLHIGIVPSSYPVELGANLDSKNQHFSKEETIDRPTEISFLDPEFSRMDEYEKYHGKPHDFGPLSKMVLLLNDPNVSFETKLYAFMNGILSASSFENVDDFTSYIVGNPRFYKTKEAQEMYYGNDAKYHGAYIPHNSAINIEQIAPEFYKDLQDLSLKLNDAKAVGTWMKEHNISSEDYSGIYNIIAGLMATGAVAGLGALGYNFGKAYFDNKKDDKTEEKKNGGKINYLNLF